MSNFQIDQSTKLDLNYRTNDAVAFAINVTDADAVAYDFTGYTATFTIYDDKKQHYQFLSGAELTLSSGNIAINIPTGSILLGAGKYQYSLRLILSGNKYTWLYGDFNISRAF